MALLTFSEMRELGEMQERAVAALFLWLKTRSVLAEDGQPWVRAADNLPVALGVLEVIEAIRRNDPSIED